MTLVAIGVCAIPTTHASESQNLAWIVKSGLKAGKKKFLKKLKNIQNPGNDKYRYVVCNVPKKYNDKTHKIIIKVSSSGFFWGSGVSTTSLLRADAMCEGLNQGAQNLAISTEQKPEGYLEGAVLTAFKNKDLISNNKSWKIKYLMGVHLGDSFVEYSNEKKLGDWKEGIGLLCISQNSAAYTAETIKMLEPSSNSKTFSAELWGKWMQTHTTPLYVGEAAQVKQKCLEEGSGILLKTATVYNSYATMPGRKEDYVGKMSASLHNVVPPSDINEYLELDARD